MKPKVNKRTLQSHIHIDRIKPTKYIKSPTVPSHNTCPNPKRPTQQPRPNQNVNVDIRNHHPHLPPSQLSPKSLHLPWPLHPRLDSLYRRSPPPSQRRKRGLPKPLQRPNPLQSTNLPTPPQTLQRVQARAPREPNLNSAGRRAQR